jgi:hypothetical protein
VLLLINWKKKKFLCASKFRLLICWRRCKKKKTSLLPAFRLP